MFASNQRVDLPCGPRRRLNRGARANSPTIWQLIPVFLLVSAALGQAQEATERRQLELPETIAAGADPQPISPDPVSPDAWPPTISYEVASTSDMILPHFGFWHEWWCSRGDMVPHFGYPVSENSNYYFRPYHITRVVRQQRTSSRWGADPRHPYDNALLDRVYEEWAEEQPQPDDAEAETDPADPNMERPEPGAPTPRPRGTTRRSRPTESLRLRQPLRFTQPDPVVLQTGYLDSWLPKLDR